MSLWRELTRGLRALTRGAAAEQDLHDEVEHFLEQATAAQAARGLGPDAARRAARLELDGPARVREQVRGYGWENQVETLLADLRYAARRLRSAPGFTAVTVLTLALGIGGTSAIFSVVNPVLFESLPYPDPAKLVAIWESNHVPQTFATHREIAERSRSFEAVAVLRAWQPTLIGGAEPERLEGQRVSAEYFRVLGVVPALGRAFEAEDDRWGGPSVVILSDALWRRRFAADSAVVGRQITLNERAHTVLGVMPEGFDNVLAPAAGLWAPLQYDLSQGNAFGHHLRMIARLAPGIRFDQAAQEVDALGRGVARRYPDSFGKGATSVAVPLQEDLTRGVKPALLAIVGGVVLVLLIACVNVTNLLLARGVQRREEFALRAALGAGRSRLIRQLLTESLLLAVLGGVAGLAVAVLGVRALVALSPESLPRLGAVEVDPAVFAFALALATLIGLAFGVAPALQAAGSAPHPGREGGNRYTAGGHRRLRSGLVVAEVALALMLLVSSGLLLRSLGRLFAVPAGFDPAGALTLQVQTSGQRFADPSAGQRFFSAALEAVRGIPGVTGAAFTSQLPLSGDLDEYGAHFDDDPDGPAASYSVFRYAVSPDYLETMAIPLRNGRALDEGDRAGAPLVALISESLARRRFPGRSPLGRQVRVGATDGAPYTIVGVVGDVKQMSLATDQADAVYIPAAQWPFGDASMSLVVRGQGDVTALTPEIRRAIWSVDRDQPILRVATLERLLAVSAAERRFALILFEAFALAALVLAAAGIYGVLAGRVAERTREIGVRAALGASRRNILALVLRSGLGLTALGLALGLAGAALATRGIEAMLFGVSRLDPVTYVGVVALLAGVALLACWIPARRAMGVDPAITLRSE
jgi:putative ABC transport system permease protein